MNIILKCRQMGISTLTAGYSLWLMTFHKDKSILVIATKQDVAKNMITKVRFMNDNLPSWLKIKETENNRTSLRLENGSFIKAVSASSDAGRSEALSLLIMDECLGFYNHIYIRNKTTNEIKKVNIGELYEENEYK
jgi:phage terminase large subunit-like protein